MPVQMNDGTSPLRSEPTVKAGSANASPGASGTPCGGTDNLKADAHVFLDKGNTTPGWVTEEDA